ncbi:MAG: hypothetical protein H7Z75_05330 [Ferruginibacter sp.]|nr:hypothetical protein [Cytophagales bacterium]
MEGQEIFYKMEPEAEQTSQGANDDQFLFGLARQPTDQSVISGFLLKKWQWYARSDVKRAMRWLIHTKDIIEGLRIESDRKDHFRSLVDRFHYYQIQHEIAKELIVEWIRQPRETPASAPDATVAELVEEDKTPSTSITHESPFVSELIARQILSGNPERPLGKATFYKLVKSGKITAYSPTPRRRVYSRSEILAYLHSQQKTR